MTDSVINHLVSTEPPTGHQICFARLDGARTLALTDLYAQAGRVATALREQGIRPGDRIGILGPNCLEWVLLDLAALRLKAVTAGFEPGKFTPDPAVLRRYDLRVLFTSAAGTASAAGDHTIRAFSDVAAMAESGRSATGQPVEIPPVSYEPGDTTTIKFTSGSTGEPKGLAASAGSIDSSIRAVQEMFEHGAADDIFVFLPLSLLQQRYWIYSALVYGHDVTVSTYETAFAVMHGVQPTVVMGVPGFFEAAKRHIEAQAARRGISIGAIARELFGGRIRYLWTGSAPASVTTLRFFAECGMPIYEGYGLNETCIVAKNAPGASKRGSVGRVLPGKQVLLGTDEVVSVRSDHPVSTRYLYSAPGDSERVFGRDGVVRTGDLGYIDEDGFLFIRGRADDTIVLDNGKKVLVRPIEEIMRASPHVEECVIFCPTQTHLVAVVSAAHEPADRAAIVAHLARANAALAHDEQIRRVVVASAGFSISNGLLTAQFKPRRQQIFDRYRTGILATEEGVYVQ
jgi:long-subunit acyl-CoA synthetase (AMP-forming)